MKNTNDAVRKIILNTSKTYNNLLGKTFLIVTEKSNLYDCIEVSFNEKNFLHLTGVKFICNKNSDNAITFYKKALANKLSNYDFEIVNDLTFKKLDVLNLACNFAKYSKMKGNFNHSKPFLNTDVLIGTDQWYLGFIYDNEEQIFVPNTLMQEDIRNVSSPAGIIFILEKGKLDSKYNLSNHVYLNKKRFCLDNYINLPKVIKNKINQ